MKTFKVTVDGRVYTVQVDEVKEDAVNISPAIETTERSSRVVEKPKAAIKATPAAGSSSIKAPMPGSVIEVRVKEGDSVKSGDVLLILEAMKMENELSSPQDGKVEQVLVKKGDTVNSGEPLIILS